MDQKPERLFGHFGGEAEEQIVLVLVSVGARVYDLLFHRAQKNRD